MVQAQEATIPLIHPYLRYHSHNPSRFSASVSRQSGLLCSFLQAHWQVPVTVSFSIAQGSTGQGYTAAMSIAETNLKEGGRVPSGVAYDVFGVACQVQHASTGTDQAATVINVAADTQALIQDLTNVINNGALRWNFTQTIIDIAPVSLVGAGGGAFGAVAQNAAGANSGAMNNGNGHIWMYRKHPVALPGNTQFSVLLDFGTRAAAVGANNGIVARVVLLGYYKNIIEIG